MKSCTSIKTLESNIERFIDHYNKQLDSGTLDKDEAASVEATLSTLKANLEAVKDNDRDYLNASGFTNQRNKEKAEIFSKVFKDNLGEEFTFRYGKGDNKTRGRLLSSAIVETGVALTIDTRNGQERYVMPLSSTGSSIPLEDSGTYIYIPNMKKVMDEYEESLSDMDVLNTILGSGKGSKLKLSADHLVGDYIHGDEASMKAMVERLHVLGGSKSTQEDLDYYNDLIEDMSEDLFDPLKLYLDSDATKSEGVTRGTGRIDIAVSGNSKIIGNQQTEASIYMEETIHSMTSAAIESETTEATKLKRQLAHTIELARNTIKVEDFLPESDYSINSEVEMAYAKELYDYIFSGKNADHEFLAKGIAMPEIRDRLKKIEYKGVKKEKFMDRLNDLFSKVVDIIRGNIALKDKPKNVHESLISLALQLGEINNKASRRKARATEGLVGHAIDIVNSMDAASRTKWEEVRNWIITKSDTKLEKMPESYYGKVKWVVDAILKSFTNPAYRKALAAGASAFGIKPDSTIREVIGGLFASDSAQKVAEYLVLQSGKVDKYRNRQIDLVRASVLAKMKNKEAITEQDEKALTSVLMDTGLFELFGKTSVTYERGIRKTVYDNKTLRTLLEDEEVLSKRIRDVKRALKQYDSIHYEWHKNQALGLGTYLATHMGTPEQNLNAANIARGIHSTHKKRVNKDVTKAIDELSTLHALAEMSKLESTKKEKVRIAELMKTEWEGIQHIADMMEGFRKNSKDLSFKDNQVNMIKGYSKELFDDSILMEIAPVADEKLMKSQGYKKVNNLNPKAGDIRNKPMAVYVTYSASRTDRMRGATRLNQIRAKGQSIKDLPFIEDPDNMPQLLAERGRRDVINIQKAALKRGKAMEGAGYKLDTSVYGVVPVLSNSGAVMDYRYMMDKQTKQRILGQDTRVTEVLARSYGTLLDKANTKEHNKKVLEALVQDMEENWDYDTIGKDGLTSYTLIGPKAETEEGKQLYYMLPYEFQEHIKARGDKVLAVRSDLKHIYFGYSNMSIANFAGMNKINPAVLTKVIKMAEFWWMEAVKVAKGNILLKTPAVLVGNIVANFVSGALKGYNPVEMAKLYTESYRDITTYNNYKKELQTLENAIRLNNVALGKDLLSSTKKTELARENRVNKQKVEALNRRIERDLSHIEEIVQLGLDQNLDDSAEIDSNRITRAIDNQLLKAPELVRDGLDLMFLTKRTSIYKIANEFLEVSDLVARDVQNRIEKKNIEKQVNGTNTLPMWWLELQPEGYKPKQRLVKEERKQFLEMAKQQREYDLVEDFINYSKPSGRFEEYLNKVGILMFTKYTKRIQRIILKNSSNHPLKTALGLLAFGFMGGYPSIHESSFMVKDYYSDSLGAGNIFPIYSPTEVMMNFITPAIVKDSTYQLF